MRTRLILVIARVTILPLTSAIARRFVHCYANILATFPFPLLSAERGGKRQKTVGGVSREPEVETPFGCFIAAFREQSSPLWPASLLHVLPGSNLARP